MRKPIALFFSNMPNHIYQDSLHMNFGYGPQKIYIFLFSLSPVYAEKKQKILKRTNHLEKSEEILY